ncbi:MAG: hypothetical protein KJ822_20040, partial [Proteobacteria bacterium]|nr:hypothetical protein [Pseudomonadota bacterium]
NSVFLFTQGSSEKTELLFWDEKNEKRDAIKEVISVKKGKEYVEIEVSFGSGGKVSFRLANYSPFLEVRALKNISRLSLKKSFGVAVLPDRLANDIIFSPSRSKPSIALPETPFIVGIPETKEEDLFLLTTPSEEQKIQLTSVEDRDVFNGMDIYLSPSAGSVFISLLCGKGFFYQQNLKAAAATDIKLDWVQPFHASWRVALSGETNRYSIMQPGEELAKLKETYLPVKTESPERFDTGLVYLYGRRWHTPLDIFTPMDVLLDVLGTEKLNDLLDLKGIRSYRVSEERVPLEIYLGLFEQDLDIYGRGGNAKMVFGGIAVGTESSYKLVTNLHNDIINILKGLDGRMVEYRNFVHSLKGNVAVQKEKIEILEKQLAALPITRVENITLSDQAIHKIRGMLNGNKDFTNFLELSRKAAKERQKALDLYRIFVKKLREYVALKAAEAPELKPVYEELRRKTGKILQNRYYLEGDWRGEDPMEAVQ